MINLKARGGGWWTFVPALRTREAFRTGGALRGDPCGAMGSMADVGHLPVSWRETLRYARPDYIVWSYGTPIAWHDPNRADNAGWTMPDVHYSVTTSIHQGYIRTAIGCLAGEYPEPQRVAYAYQPPVSVPVSAPVTTEAWESGCDAAFWSPSLVECAQ